MKENNSQKKMTLKEAWQVPRYKAMIKMGLWLLLIGCIIIYIHLGSNMNSHVDTTIPNVKDTSDKDDLLTKLDDNNYHFNIDVTSIDTEEHTYNLKGTRYNDQALLTINDTNDYYINQDSYYHKVGEQYELTNIDSIFSPLAYRYLNLANIKEYLKKGTIEHTTNQDQSTLTTSKVPIKEILLNKNTTDSITINILEEKENLTITIDYTNLMKIDNDKIIKYEVKTNYTDIGTIESL